MQLVMFFDSNTSMSIHEHRTFTDFTILKKSKRVLSATRVPGYLTDIKMGTRVPIPGNNSGDCLFTLMMHLMHVL